MFEIWAYTARRRVRGSIAMAVGISVLAALVIWVFPSFQSSINIDDFLDAYPEPVLKAFGIETMATLEGFLAVELYSFAWVILLGLYTAYAVAGMVAGAVEQGRMDLWLSLPVRRWRLLLEQYLSILVPIVVVNVVTPVVVYGGSVLIDQPIAIRDLVLLHAISIPYLTTTAAIGLVFGVLLPRGNLAERLALAVVFGLFLVESLLTDTDLEWVGGISPTKYFEVNDVLIRGQVDPVPVGVLVGATVVLVALAAGLFSRKDVR